LQKKHWPQAMTKGHHDALTDLQLFVSRADLDHLTHEFVAEYIAGLHSQGADRAAWRIVDERHSDHMTDTISHTAHGHVLEVRYHKVGMRQNGLWRARALSVEAHGGCKCR
jgi:hypothetical protein